jgi:amino acid adenylation domain-containing protein
MTYCELNRRANQLAHHLQGVGVGPEQLVGICIERSIDLLIGILAVAKTGGAYVPLDPSYPAERLSFILEDCGARALLTNEGLRGKFAHCETTMVLLDRDRERIASQPIGNLTSSVTTGNLAYVIYTSGSTGLPKGVQITHASLMNLIGWHQRASALSPGDRTALVAAIGFDASVFELWPNLTAGVTIHLPDEETRLSPVKLRDWIVTQEITVCFVPTPLAELILSLNWPPDASLRILHTGGDKLHNCPDTLPFQVVNNYGPTESTVIATSCRVDSESPAQGQSPSIGRPIDNVQAYILDRNLTPVPARVPGELYVGGAALARGYLNQFDLTAANFIPHPFATSPGERLYRTGDLARYRPDGRIEFLGRYDQQIKIHGYRIELGEIEGVLNKHPEVRESVVVCGEDGHGEKRLTAYLVLKETGQLSVDELRASLVEKLPSFMIPLRWWCWSGYL